MSKVLTIKKNPEIHREFLGISGDTKFYYLSFDPMRIRGKF